MDQRDQRADIYTDLFYYNGCNPMDPRDQRADIYTYNSIVVDAKCVPYIEKNATPNAILYRAL